MAALVTTALRDRLRAAAFRRTYTDRLVVWKVTGYRQRPTGGSVPNYEVRASNVPCRVAPGFAEGTENTVGGQVQDVKRATVYTAPDLGIDIEARDLFEIQPTDEETEPIVINVTASEIRRSTFLERITKGLVIGGRGAVPT